MAGPIHHIDIKAIDAEEMAEFFTLLGYEIDRETDHRGGSYEMRHPEDDLPFIEIVPAADNEDPGIRHLAFSADDIDAATEDLLDWGARHLNGPSTNQDTGRTIADFRDPDGKWIQLVSDPE